MTIPDNVRADLHLEPRQPVEIVVHEGRVLIRPIDIDPEQARFWTPEWQAKEREADQAYADGRFTRFYAAPSSERSARSLKTGNEDDFGRAFGSNGCKERSV